MEHGVNKSRNKLLLELDYLFLEFKGKVKKKKTRIENSKCNKGKSSAEYKNERIQSFQLCSTSE